MNTPQWQQRTERGNRWLAGLILWVTACAGRSVARGLLYLVCCYYAVFLQRERRAVSHFLSRAQGRARVPMSTVVHHFHCFATTLLDRIYILQGQWHELEVQVVGRDVLDEALALGRGCILLGSHLGSFEIARACAREAGHKVLQVLMHEENAPLAKELTRRMNPDLAGCVIPAGRPETMLRVKECLDGGQMLGLLGDRVLDERQGDACDFFGRRTRFPASPYRLAALLNAPVVLFFGLFRGGNRYELHFETLAHDIQLHPEQREQQLRAWVGCYAKRLEHFCRLAPDNWFNFYEFWEQDG